MLQAYTKQDDIPEALREHYLKGADGKWHAEIPTDHPSIRDAATLLNDKQAAETKVAQLESDLEHAKVSSIPRGHKAVPNADYQLLEEVKTLGTVAEIKTRLDEHKTLSERVAKQEREDSLKLVAKELGYDNVDAFIRLPGLPEFDIREKDGKKQVIAKVKDDKGVYTEKPAKEFIESSSDIAPFLPALTRAAEGIDFHGTTGDGTSGTDPFAAARKFGADWNERNKPAGDVMADFGMAKSA